MVEDSDQVSTLTLVTPITIATAPRIITDSTSASLEMVQDILDQAKNKMRHSVLCVNGMPSKTEMKEMSKISLQAAAAEVLGRPI